MSTEAFIALALAFALVSGANDGGALLAPGLRAPGLGLAPALGILIGATTVIPWALAAPVAWTIVSSIVPPDDAGSVALFIAFCVAVVVVWLLTARGLPTSLTLAIIGAIAGAGLGGGASVSWSDTLVVLMVAAAAPLVGMGLALTMSRLWTFRDSGAFLPTMRRGHVFAFVMQCVAYGSNDGQKILVLLLAAGLALPDGRLTWWWYPLVGVAFFIGAVLGLRKVAGSIGSGILNTTPGHIVTSELAAAGAVLGSTALGAPVSMTQAIVGSLVGAGVHESRRRIRWRVVRGLGLSWVVTLPLSLGLAAMVGYSVSLFA